MAGPVVTPWTITAIRLSTVEGPVHIPGWTNGALTIDWRAGLDHADQCCAYVISVAEPGWALCAITADLDKVIAAADAITQVMDWSGWTDMVRAKMAAHKPALRAIFDQHGAKSPKLYMMPAGVAALWAHDAVPVEAVLS